MEFHSQQLVWAELVDSPHWPGVIIDESDIQSERPSSEINKEFVPVHLLGEYKNTWIDQDSLQLYEANREKYHNTSVDPIFVKAVEEADGHLQKQKEDSQYLITIKPNEKKESSSESNTETVTVEEKPKTDYVEKDITDIFNNTPKTEETASNSDEISLKKDVTSDATETFQLQQIVWAKMTGHPYWPAVIIEEADISAKRPGKKANKEHFPVQFLGENTNGWIVKSQICPFEEYRQKYCKGSKNQLFIKALSEADEHVKKQKEDAKYEVKIKRTKKRTNGESPAVRKKSSKRENGESLTLKKTDKEEKPIKNEIVEVEQNGMKALTGEFDVDAEFAVQQLVWAKMMGHPYWPAVIIEESQVNAARPPKMHKQFYPVQFLGEYANAWVEKKFICPYAENKDKYSDCSKNQLFLQALDEADEHLEKQKEDNQYRIKIKQAGAKDDDNDNSQSKKRRIKEEKLDENDITSTPIKKRKTEINTDNMEYTEQQIVWAKMVGHPHWPAVIINEVEVDAEKPSSKSNKQYYPVVFLGDYTHAWVEKNHIYPYEKNIEKYSKSSKTQFFAQALGQANEHFQKQKENSEYRINFERSPKRRSGKVKSSPKKVDTVEKTIVQEEFTVNTADKLTIGIVGIGLIGAELVKRLVRAGYTVKIWNRTLAQCKKVERDLNRADNLTTLISPRNVLVKSDIIFVCVSDRSATKRIIEHDFEGTNDNENLLKSKGILMMTSMSAEESNQMHDCITKKGGKYLEVALQGSRSEASQGTLTLLTAGDEALFHHCQPYFEVIGRGSYYFGSVGYAIKINLALQMVKGVSLGVLGEAIAFAERCGVERQKFIDVFNSSDMATPYLKDKAVFINDSNFSDVQQPLTHMQNDLKMIMEMADSMDHSLSLANTVNEMYKECIRKQYGDHDVSSVFLKNKR